MNLGKVNLIIHVFKLGRFTEEECKFVQVYVDVFKNTQCISSFVITGCDFKSDASCTSIVDIFKSNDYTKDFAAIMDKGIYTIGFCDLSDFADDAGLKEHLELRQKKDLTKLHQLIEKSSDAVDVLKSSDIGECSVS